MISFLGFAVALTASTVLALPTTGPRPDFFGDTPATTSPLSERAISVHQAFPQDFPDPSIFKDASGKWFAFSSGAAGVNVQIATSNDAQSWSLLSGQDALPRPGAWVDQAAPTIWAPDVVINDQGQYVLFYSGAVSGGAMHCVGVATASSPQGPYSALPQPFACPQSQGGAIDASGFRDSDGKLYVTYKIDGNSIGHGGSCNNGVDPRVATPIMLQPVGSDFHTATGGAVKILDRGSADGPLVEAPSLMRDPKSGNYVLFFSSNCYSSTNYDISYAFASNINGPYTKAGPFARTGSASGLSAPGGLDVAHDGSHALFHAGPVGDRALWVTGISVDAQNMVVNS